MATNSILMGLWMKGALYTILSVNYASMLPINPLNWLNIAILATLTTIGIASMLYMLGPTIKLNGMKQWSINQIYEAFISIALILIFIGLLQFMLMNPQQPMSKANLVPQGCTNANTIYTLSTCDLSQFNNASYTMVDYIYAYSAIKYLTPSIEAKVFPIPSQDDIFAEIKFPNPFDALGTNMLRYSFDAMVAFFVLAQVQLILLSSSLLFFSFFVTLGLISRTFGILRTFGGAMLALGIGIGLLFPLMVSISYGFVDVSANTACLQSLLCTSGTVASNINPISVTANSINFIADFILSFITPFQNAVGMPGQSLGAVFAPIFTEVGYIFAGLTFIPAFNIIIVDMFVSDLSSALGQKVSFQQLFTRLI